MRWMCGSFHPKMAIIVDMGVNDHPRLCEDRESQEKGCYVSSFSFLKRELKGSRGRQADKDNALCCAVLSWNPPLGGWWQLFTFVKGPCWEGRTMELGTEGGGNDRRRPSFAGKLVMPTRACSSRLDCCELESGARARAPPYLHSIRFDSIRFPRVSTLFSLQ